MTAYLITPLSIVYSSKNHINKVLTYIYKMYINNVKQSWFNIQKLKLFTILTGLKKKNHDSLYMHKKTFDKTIRIQDFKNKKGTSLPDKNNLGKPTVNITLNW